jgi:hypothetical protein
VTVEKAGLEKYVESGIALDVEQTIALTIAMRVVKGFPHSHNFRETSPEFWGGMP